MGKGFLRMLKKLSPTAGWQAWKPGFMLLLPLGWLQRLVAGGGISMVIGLGADPWGRRLEFTDPSPSKPGLSTLSKSRRGILP